ncbi:response regulator transcription factor [Sulfurovum sp. ST-21]|uniref:Response regulator transcription factor n=1 Tax=Sulfurovum indicum TaxID=2779528 RepID=A0A7M1S126_9BACT|nr:response regulator transcription factor [Sulfurovum indicum]QOR61108.1 response regulator transcription factor [Sulfurovum indicum]HIP18807.1 response regulator transcription factor [Sulfurovum sp.]
MKILLMEDDPVLGDILTDYLQQYYTTRRAFDSAEAQEFIDEESYDLFIFDINVPGKSGIELLKEIRSFNDTTPAIIITAYEDTRHLKESFDVGAHDYIRKPFELEELRLRIEKSKVLFRIEQDSLVKLSDTLTYYPQRHLVSDGVNEKTLRPKECEILEYFIAHPQRLISPEELIQNIWGFDALPSDATLRSYIRNLREVIGADKIITQRGLGYRYE